MGKKERHIEFPGGQSDIFELLCFSNQHSPTPKDSSFTITSDKE